MQKIRFHMPTLFGSTGSVIQKFMVAPIVDLLRLHEARR